MIKIVLTLFVILSISNASEYYYEVSKWKTRNNDSVYVLNYSIFESYEDDRLSYYKDSLYSLRNVDVLIDSNTLLRLSGDSIFEKIEDENISKYLDDKTNRPFYYKRMIKELDTLDYQKFTNDDKSYSRYKYTDDEYTDILEFYISDTTVTKHYRYRKKNKNIVTDTFILRKVLSNRAFIDRSKLNLDINTKTSHYSNLPKIKKNRWSPLSQQINFAYFTIDKNKEKTNFENKNVIIIGFQSCVPCFYLKTEIGNIIEKTNLKNVYYFSIDEPNADIIKKDSIFAYLNPKIKFGYIDKDEFVNNNGNGGYPIMFMIEDGVLKNYIEGYNYDQYLEAIKIFLN